MTPNARTTTLLSLITQQLMEISQAAVRDDPEVLLRLTSATEQLHGAQVLLELAGMNPLTNPVPKSDNIEDHLTRLPARPPKPEPFFYPSNKSPEWKKIADMLRVVKGGIEAETHEIKAAIRGNYPAYQCGDKVRFDGQLTTVIRVRLPLELESWLYQTAMDRDDQHTEAALERVPMSAPVANLKQPR